MRQALIRAPPGARSKHSVVQLIEHRGLRYILSRRHEFLRQSDTNRAPQKSRAEPLLCRCHRGARAAQREPLNRLKVNQAREIKEAHHRHRGKSGPLPRILGNEKVRQHPGFRGCRLFRISLGTKARCRRIFLLIGFIAGVIAKFVTPGSTHEPQGFILTTALGIVGALVATYLGQALGWYQAGQGAGFIASIVGAVLILLVWGFIASRRT